jgi:hypothetical protein
MNKPLTVVDEANYGVYLWKMPNGQYVGDDQENFLSIAAIKGDAKKMQRLREVVKTYGIAVGEPCFLSGRRKVTDEEYAEQKDRMASGLIADPYDFGAIKDQMRADG